MAGKHAIKMIGIHLILAVIALFFLTPMVWLFVSAFDPKASVELKIPERLR